MSINDWTYRMRSFLKLELGCYKYLYNLVFFLLKRKLELRFNLYGRKFLLDKRKYYSYFFVFSLTVFTSSSISSSSTYHSFENEASSFIFVLFPSYPPSLIPLLNPLIFFLFHFFFFYFLSLDPFILL